MKNQKQRQTAEKDRRPAQAPIAAATARVPDKTTAPASSIRWWHVALGVLAALLIAFEVYGPALHGEFVFDDSYLPFMVPAVAEAPLRAWLGVRPFLMLSYWWNYQVSGLDPYPYHAINVLLHGLNGVLAWAVVRRYLKLAGNLGVLRETLALFAGALFLLHPAQTESVAYVSSRSEAMSIFFFLAALAVFLYRGAAAIGWGRAVAVIALFGVACTVKEHTVTLPALLLLTDYYFTSPFRLKGIRDNWRLYVPIVAVGAAGLVAVFRVLSVAESAGFRVKEFTWYQYLFTQFRSIWLYIRLYFFPVRQNADYDLTVSRNLIDQGAIVGLLALLAAAAIAWRYRREYPLASFGFFGFLLLLAPTSSIVPIRDVAVERRLYLPFICLLLITVDLIRRWRISRPALVAMLALVTVGAAAASYQRNQVWSNALALWQDTVTKSPHNSRAWFQLAYAQWQAGRCSEAAATYGKVAGMRAQDDQLLVDWALALECAGKPADAINKLREAALKHNSAHIQATIGMIQAKQGRSEEALASLEQAEKLDARFEMTYVYRGNVYVGRGDSAGAAAEYGRALAINPSNQPAKEALTRLQSPR